MGNFGGWGAARFSRKENGRLVERRPFLLQIRRGLDAFCFSSRRNDAIVFSPAHSAFLFVIFAFIVSHEDKERDNARCAKLIFIKKRVRHRQKRVRLHLWRAVRGSWLLFKELF
ncbi:MAG: hypothetical protein EBS01_09965 [Verrucomicrobia bacterium]|nr:hypothetical protein [Verrucomicrobiota bacterium]